jgi:hypothetical protein
VSNKLWLTEASRIAVLTGVITMAIAVARAALSNALIRLSLSGILSTGDAANTKISTIDRTKTVAAKISRTTKASLIPRVSGLTHRMTG